jgi:hypothetical protein
MIFDFGKEVGRIMSLGYSANESGEIDISFFEAKNWTGIVSDGSNSHLIWEGMELSFPLL